MTVQELIELLMEYDPETDVIISSFGETGEGAAACLEAEDFELNDDGQLIINGP